MAENTDLLKKMDGWPGDQDAGWVQTYDPDVRVVLFIIREKGGVSGYLIGANPRPSEAFAQQLAKGN